MLEGFFLECIIVDNSDHPEFFLQIKALENKFNFVKVIRPGVNTGYFGAFNFVFKNDLIDLNSLVVICNNDLVFNSLFCDCLLKSHYPKDVFVVCPDVVTTDGYHQNPHLVAPLSFMGRLKLDLYFSNYYLALCMISIYKIFNLSRFKRNHGKHISVPMYLHMGIGACYVLTRNFFSKFTELNYPYFLYGEEAFLSSQVHAAGGRLFYDPNLVVEHNESATLSKTPKKTAYKYARDGYCEYRRMY
ncbi:hypothetical protein [Polynucleobacter sp. AM-25C3]|uniref:glycosyltransferase family 2 protein n=1 Tax=Polynucleobacter sp. AM-25C3 TaxID=1855569 RepID=UPI001C0B145C|nr:hypothetical protein [Polynucleobacter sp. AM-25C3]MBU3602778.1 glycosyltransferase family 2 protein [Polynucleobacter sp. AM-25C3]